MRQVIFKNSFKKSLKKAEKRGKNPEKLFAIITLLAETGTLPPKNKPHKLSGNRAGEWECHIEPDWLLIYIIDDKFLTLIETGTHSDLFE